LSLNTLFKTAQAASVEPQPLDVTDAQGRMELLDDFESLGLAWFWATDAAGELIYISEAAADRLGKSPAELLGQSLCALFFSDEDEAGDRPQRPLTFLMSARSTFNDITVGVATGTPNLWWQFTGRPKFASDGEFTGFRGSAKDVTAAYLRQKETARLSQYDSLTGLANRHRMGKQLNAILATYRVTERNCALMMLDLDRFKAVNDTFGHPVGDALLKEVAERIERIVGSRGEIGRLGGDEFQVILRDVADPEELGELAGRLIQMLSQPYLIGDSRAVIGASVGIAISPLHGADPTSLVKSADLALYAAKTGGRGRHQFYSSELGGRADERRAMEDDLLQALSKGQIELHYQPVVRAKDNVATGCEALMRWNHPERGTIAPDMFLPLAAESELGCALGQWALRRACGDAAGWPGNLKVAVNISAGHFFSDGFVDTVADALASSELASERLELEVTEAVFMGDVEAADEVFARLRDLGVRLAHDDFGTGFSSLACLRRAPFDKLKLDQSFIRDCTGADNAALLTATIGLARALRMETVAEGVETADELAILRKRGITHVQGFVFCGALPHDAIVERLSEGTLCFPAVGPSRQRAERKTVFRRVVIIHEGQRYQAVMRNISRTGARIEGLLEVPVGTDLLIELSAGQLTLATVRFSDAARQGIEFAAPLASDARGEFVTRQRSYAFERRARGRRTADHLDGAVAPPDEAKAPARFVEVQVSTGEG